MYTKEEEKQLRIDFWNELNEILMLERGLHGSKVNWMSFNTKIKQLFFRMEADDLGARLCIDLQFVDAGVREVFYEQFTEFSNILEREFEGEEIQWKPEFAHSNGKVISRISIERANCSLYKREDWPAMHAFLKDNFVKLERFWAEFSTVFTNLK